MDLRQRLSRLVAIRAVAVTLLLGSATLIEVSRPGAFPVDPFYFLIGLTYALSVGYLWTLRWVDRHPWLADVHFAADTVLVAAFIHVTGGITSLFSSLFVLPIIAAGTIRFRRGALQVTGLAALLYTGLVLAQYRGWLASVSAQELPPVVFADFTVAINLAGFLGVALLSGSLAERARATDDRLRDVSHEIADLRVFNDHVIDSLLSGLMTVDVEGRIRTFNRGASTITGVAVVDALRADVNVLMQLPEEFRDRLRLLALTPASSLKIDRPYRRPDGRRIEVGITVAALAFPTGRPGLLFTFQDVTEVKRLEREGRLQGRLAAVGEMAAGIAHEIRNPLASMSGSIQVLRQELALSDEQGELMDIVVRESERLNDTIRSFLAYARPQPYAVTRLDVRGVVRDTAILLRNSADVRDGHVIDVDVPDTPVWFAADENQLRQVVWNLATNGLRSMAAGGRLRLATHLEPTADGTASLLLVVEDEGCGIAPDEIDGIFQPFHSSFERGTGLGLAIVHRIVTDHRGAIDLTSTPGIGTAVRVRIPDPGTVVTGSVPAGYASTGYAATGDRRGQDAVHAGAHA